MSDVRCGWMSEGAEGQCVLAAGHEERVHEWGEPPTQEELPEMDMTDIAAAALKANHKGPCSCKHRTKDRKPHPACPKCHGQGTLTACGECEGSGWSAANNKLCQKCQGNGYL
jgi:hypothetical protein